MKGMRRNSPAETITVIFQSGQEVDITNIAAFETP